ncbi:leucine-rich repeat protein [Butyrivibrio sp. AD3002]|uniref:leucine-rich repeat protein n=1 Tax=Butyrivibrio sp. AD3002 TaxID=1280670 RepID=UPI0003B481E3|nr:leucine-rich repeat protein [Butyrivibrio sp. AD3002]
MTNINIKLKKILALTLAVAMVFSIAAVSTLTVKASETHSKGYDWMVEKLDANVAAGTTTTNTVDYGDHVEEYTKTEAASLFDTVEKEADYKENFITVTEAELEELKTKYKDVRTGYYSTYPNQLQTLWDNAWMHFEDPILGTTTQGWADAIVNPIQDTSSNSSSNNTANTSDNNQTTDTRSELENYSNVQGYTVHNPSEYGYDTIPGWNIYAHIPAGSTFRALDGIIYKVTKEGGYRSLGQVQIIGYDTVGLEYHGRAQDSQYLAMTAPKKDILLPNTVQFNEIGELYGVTSSYDDKKRAHKQGEDAFQAWRNGLNRFGSKVDDNKVVNAGSMFVNAYSAELSSGTSVLAPEYFVITSIAQGAFKGDTDLKKAYLPESVTEIPKDCFSGCKNLQEVTWGSNSLKITEKDSLCVNSGMPKAKAKKSIAKNAFYKCKKLKTFNLYGAYAQIKVAKNAFGKDKKTITVKTYNKNKWTNKFAKDIHSKGNAKKETKLKLGVQGNSTADTIQETKKKSSKKSKK